MEGGQFNQPRDGAPLEKGHEEHGGQAHDAEQAGQNQHEPLSPLRRLDFTGPLRRHGLLEQLDARGHVRGRTLCLGGGRHPVALDEQLRAVNLFLNLKKGVQRILRDFVLGLTGGNDCGVRVTAKHALSRPNAENATGTNHQKLQAKHHAHTKAASLGRHGAKVKRPACRLIPNLIPGASNQIPTRYATRSGHCGFPSPEVPIGRSPF